MPQEPTQQKTPLEYLSTRYETHPDAPGKRVYGGIVGRYYQGTPGVSPRYTSTALLFEPILLEDQESLEDQIKAEIVGKLANQIEQSTGLRIQEDEIAPRIEWKAIWRADGNLVRALQFFEEGLDRRTPTPVDTPGRPLIIRPGSPGFPGNLTATQIRSMMNRMKGKRP